MESREFRVLLPFDVPSARYAAIVHAVAAVLDAADVALESSIFVDGRARDEEMNAAFDRFSALYLVRTTGMRRQAEASVGDCSLRGDRLHIGRVEVSSRLRGLGLLTFAWGRVHVGS